MGAIQATAGKDGSQTSSWHFIAECLSSACLEHLDVIAPPVPVEQLFSNPPGDIVLPYIVPVQRLVTSTQRVNLARLLGGHMLDICRERFEAPEYAAGHEQAFSEHFALSLLIPDIWLPKQALSAAALCAQFDITRELA